MSDEEVDKAKCLKTVADHTGWHFNRCSKPVRRDGYCTVHHPDAVAARHKKADERYKSEMAPRLNASAIAALFGNDLARAQEAAKIQAAVEWIESDPTVFVLRQPPYNWLVFFDQTKAADQRMYMRLQDALRLKLEGEQT